MSDAGGLSCAEARQLLGAYRLDDRSPEQFTALARHLMACEACRSVEVSFRRAGALVRHLPTEVPPPSFRASVFAAIAAEQNRMAKYRAKYGSGYESPAARVARAQTDPGLPVVRVRPRTRHRTRRSATPALPVRAVAALAAVLLVGLVGASVLPASGVSALGNALGGLFGGEAGPPVAHYLPTGRFSLAASALASTTWLVYSAADRSGQTMLLARNRRTGSTVDLLGSPERSQIMLQALTSAWAIWSEGEDDANSDWSLFASHLPSAGGQGAGPTLLARNANSSGDTSSDALMRFTGMWAGSGLSSGDTVLLTALTRDGTSKLLRIDLDVDGSPQTRVVARASAPDRLLTSPSWDGRAYVWSEVWAGDDGRLHSTIWQGDDAGHVQAVSSDDTAFAPRVANGMLLWIEAQRNAAATQAKDSDLGGIARAEETVSGALEARALGGGRVWQVASGAEVGTLQADGPFVLWRAGGKGTAAGVEHAYDLRAHAASAADALVRAAQFAEASGAALTWGERSGAIAVMDR